MEKEDGKSIREIFDDIKDKSLVLPDFQRGYVWTSEKTKNFLCSVLLKLPIGTLLLVEGKKNDFQAKRIGMAKDYQEQPQEKCSYLLDGQQRLTTLWGCFTDLFNDSDNNSELKFDSVYKELRKRWFVYLKPRKSDKEKENEKENENENESDLFGYESLNFDPEKIIKAEPADIYDYISFETIKNKKEVFDPSHSSLPKNSTDQLKEEAKQIRIPLYALYKGSSHLRLLINRIANQRIAEIKSDINEIKELNDKKILVKKYFDKYIKDNPDDGELIESSDEEELDLYIQQNIFRLSSAWETDIRSYLENLLTANVSILKLKNDEINRAIAIFTAINEGGQKLSTYDLIVAKAAKNKNSDSLPDQISTFIKESKVNIDDSGIGVKDNIKDWTLDYVGCIDDKENISESFKENFLNVLCGLVTTDYKNKGDSFCDSLKIDCFKAKLQLKMSSDKIADYVDLALKGLQRAHAFLQFRCGLVSINDLSYKLIVLPLAFCLINDECWNDHARIDRLEFWYWSSIFSGIYRDKQNANALHDIKLLYKWLVIHKGNDSLLSDDEKGLLADRREKIFTASDYSDQLTLTREGKNTSVPKAISTALLQYVLSRRPGDFLPSSYKKLELNAWSVAAFNRFGITPNIVLKDSSEPNVLSKNADLAIKKFDLSLEDHHIYPLGAATNLGESSKELRTDKSHILNSPLNRTLISSTANSLLSDMAPSDYYDQIDKSALKEHIAPDWNADYKSLKSSGSPVPLSQRIAKLATVVLLDRFNEIVNAVGTELDGIVKFDINRRN